MSQSEEAQTIEATPPRTTGTDLVTLAVLLLVAALLFTCGGGLMVAALLMFVVFLSMMTMYAVMEERGGGDPTVQRARRLLPLVGLCLLPIVLVWVLGFPPLYGSVFLVAGIFAVFYVLRQSPGRMTLRTLLRGANEKGPAYFDLQISRAFILVVVAFAALLFDPSNVTRTLRDGPSRMAEERRLLNERPSVSELIAASENLQIVLDGLLLRLGEEFSKMTREEKQDFMDHVAGDEEATPQWQLRILVHLLERERDPAVQERLIGMINERADLRIPSPPPGGHNEAKRHQIVRDARQWMDEQ